MKLGQANGLIRSCDACQPKRRSQIWVTFWDLVADVFTKNGSYLACLKEQYLQVFRGLDFSA